MSTLIYEFLNTKPGYLDHDLVWRIYDHRTGRKLAHDYGSLKGDFIYDDYIIVSKSVKEAKSGEHFLRVTVSPA